MVASVSVWSKGNEVDVAAVSPNYQGFGIGMAFYEWILSHLGSLSSSDNLSKGASLLWSRLVKKHHGWLRIPGRAARITIHGFQKKKGFMWPIVERDGKPVNLWKFHPENARYVDVLPEETEALRNFYYEVRR
jgi:GNAT superfamily N-acetyltransferase